MEGKRVSYKDYELIVKSKSSSGMFFTEQNPTTKFGTVVGLFENGKVCVKCDEDKILRLFDIEKLVIVDKEYEKAKLHYEELDEIFTTHLPKNEGESAFDYLLRCNEFYHTSLLFNKYKVSADDMLKFIKGDKI